MFVVLHVTIAIGGLVWLGPLWLRPTVAKFRIAYGLIAGTLLSGTYLVWSTHSPILSGCLAGLTYLTIGVVGIALARRKFSYLES